MLVTVSAWMDHFLQKQNKGVTNSVRMATKDPSTLLEREPSKLLQACYVFAKYFRSGHYQNLQNVCAPHQTDVCEMQ